MTKRGFPFAPLYRSKGQKGYWRLIWHFATTYSKPNPYMDRHLSQYQIRMSKIKTLNGPIHSLWCNWSYIRWNWFTLGLRCAWKGHEWREEFITVSPGKRLVAIKDAPGHTKWEPTGKWERHYIKACAQCGKYMGHGYEEKK